MKPIEWNTKELFTGYNGAQAVRLATHDQEGVRLELSMHDETIRLLVPQEAWMPVHTLPTTSAMIGRDDGWIVVLIGFGGSDPLGNLMLWRFKLTPGFHFRHYMELWSYVGLTLDRLGIKIDSSVNKRLCGN
jgi:hypothetical protein